LWLELENKCLTVSKVKKRHLLHSFVPISCNRLDKKKHKMT
jgi:hypothetical protein